MTHPSATQASFSESEDGLTWPDILACERVVLRFTAAFDASYLEGMLAEWTPDGVWQRQEDTVRGHDGLRTLMTARLPGLFVRHIVTNMRVEPAGPGAATCTSYVTVFRHDGGHGDPTKPVPLGLPALLGRYNDVLRRVDGIWKLSGRSVTVDMRQA